MDQLLIVDDNEINVQLLQSYLKQKGYVVRSAKNGLEAIEQVIKFNPDLILMDLQMPYMDGWEATRRIKARTNSKHIPIIAVSAYLGKDDHEKLTKTGFNDYISKPVDLASEQILFKIRTLLARRGGTRVSVKDMSLHNTKQINML